MRTIRIVIMLILVAGLSLCACQPTPELAIVQQKSNSFTDELEALTEAEASMVEPDPADTGEGGSENFRNTALQHWETDFRLKAAPNVHVVIDADVLIPEGPFPVYTVVSSHVSQENADSFLAGFEGAEYKPYTQVRTKSDYLEEIEALQEYLQSEPEEGADPEENQKYREDALESLTLLMQLMEDAPEDLDSIPYPAFTNQYLIQESISGDLFLEGARNDADSLRALYEKVKSHYEETGEKRIDVTWRDAFRNYRFYARFAQNDLNDELRFQDQAYEGLKTVFRPIGEGLGSCSYEDALDVARESLQRAGVSGMTLVHSAKECSYAAKDYGLAHDQRNYKDLCYVFWFSREIDGLGANFASNPMQFVSMTDQAWGQDYVIVKVSEKGLVWLEAHNAYNELGEPIGVSKEQIPLERIQSIIEEQLNLGNLRTPMGEEVSVSDHTFDFVFSSLELGYMKVKLGDNSGRYVYTPVWDLYGYYTETGDKGFQNNSMDNTRSYRFSYLTINAIDGTIIDRSVGY